MSGKETALLVVDDNEDNRYILNHRLRRLGYTDVTSASDGRKALELLRSRRFDLMLLDVMMPEMSGFEVLERLRTDGLLEQLSVIMISALTDAEGVARCLALGAEDYLPKPFNPALLRNCIGLALNKRRLRDAARLCIGRLDQALATIAASDSGVGIYLLRQSRPTATNEVYDFFYVGEETLFVAAGAVAVGWDAASASQRLRRLVRTAATPWRRGSGGVPRPDQIIRSVNAELCSDRGRDTAAILFLARLGLSSGTVSFCNAGSLPPYLLRGGGFDSVRSVFRGYPLGLDAQSAYQAEPLRLDPGDGLFVHGLGLVGVFDGAGAASTNGFPAAPAPAGRLAPPAVEAVVPAQGTLPATDDVVALAVRWQPRATGGDGRPR